MFAAAAGFALAASQAFAGGGPENVLLLVNSNSNSSKTIANHYIQLRKIPPTNVLYVDWKGSLEMASGKNFRAQVLLPALQAIDDRGLGGQIDYIVYSSDFPWRLDLTPVFPDDKFAPPFGPTGSTTGVTYLAPFLVGPKPNPALVMPNTNWYVPSMDEKNLYRCQALANVPSRGFRFRYAWTPQGQKVPNPALGQRYFLCTMLGVTQGRGNTVPEVISYLKRAAAADGRRPRGTIYYMWNKDIRSTTRHACYESIAAEINRLGVQARVMQGTIPKAVPDIMGLMTGVADFDFAASGSTILPGAICDHLTSAGGMLAKIGGQTPLTVFLKNGAAGASGTVVEPRSIQAKFPLPSLHLHYVRGCSLAESFFQSVSGPYQLLIVGDPLCQPWAVIPGIKMVGAEPGKKVSGNLELAAVATAGPGKRVGTFEWFVDGRLVARSVPGKTVSLDTTKLADGFHELRVVGANEDPIETQGRAIVPIGVDNHAAAIEITVRPLGKVAPTAKLRITLRQPGATAIAIRQNSRELARVSGEAGNVEIEASKLGAGPTTLQATSEGPAPAASIPIPIEVQ